MTVKPIIAGRGGGPGGGRGPLEIAWAHNRPLEHRVPRPKRGDHVLYRSNEWFEPVDAEIVDPAIETDHPDMQWPEPWPFVLLRIIPPWPEHKLDVSGHRLAGAAGPLPYQVKTQEARLAGAAGWLPLDWRTRVYPEVGY